MNILHLIPYFMRATKTGGPALHVSRLAQAEQALGNRVHIVTTTGNLDEEIDLAFSGPTFNTFEQGLPTTYLHRKSRIYPSTYYYAPALSCWLKANLYQFDIVIIHGTWTYFNWAGAGICRELGKPYLIFLHGIFDTWALNYHRVKKITYWHLIEKSNFKQASGVIILSKDEDTQLRKMGIEKPAFLARNGLLYPLLQVQNSDELIKSHLPTLDGHPYVYFMSRLHPKKGLEVLLEAWGQVHAHHPEWRLVIAGPDEGGYLGKLYPMIDKLNIKESILLPGLVMSELKAALLQRASLFILPSLSEGVPGAVIDALAYGLPVLITPACHLPEVMEAQAGLVINPEIQAIAKGLDHLMSSRILRQKMGRNAEQLARNQFDESSVARGLVTFCQSLLSQKL